MAKLLWNPQRWEYKSYAPREFGPVTDEEADRRLLELGAKGWELVSVYVSSLVVYVFKRPLPPPGVEVR